MEMNFLLNFLQAFCQCLARVMLFMLTTTLWGINPSWNLGNWGLLKSVIQGHIVGKEDRGRIHTWMGLSQSLCCKNTKVGQEMTKKTAGRSPPICSLLLPACLFLEFLSDLATSCLFRWHIGSCWLLRSQVGGGQEWSLWSRARRWVCTQLGGWAHDSPLSRGPAEGQCQ